MNVIMKKMVGKIYAKNTPGINFPGWFVVSRPPAMLGDIYFIAVCIHFCVQSTPSGRLSGQTTSQQHPPRESVTHTPLPSPTPESQDCPTVAQVLSGSSGSPPPQEMSFFAGQVPFTKLNTQATFPSAVHRCTQHKAALLASAVVPVFCT